MDTKRRHTVLSRTFDHGIQSAAKASANFVLSVLILSVAIFILVDWLPCWDSLCLILFIV